MREMDIAHEEEMGSPSSQCSSSVSVFCRVRPENKLERSRGGRVAVFFPSGQQEQRQSVRLNDLTADEDGRFGQIFTFDRVFGPHASQVDVFRCVGFPVVEAVLNGANGTILAYGQTSSGKTFTMEGEGWMPSPLTVREEMEVDEVRAGIVPRALKALVDGAEQMRIEGQAELELKVSVIEIYLERIRDLLDEMHRHRVLQVREDPALGVWVEGAIERTVRSEEEVRDVLSTAWSNRSRGKTRMNASSSRSHCIVMATLVEDGLECGRLFMVDLAGSEKSPARGIRMEEAKKINKSLSALAQVIQALTKCSPAHVPYRDSTLTRVLQQSLHAHEVDGNGVEQYIPSKTAVIVCCSPSSCNHRHTLNTLRFASRTKFIPNGLDKSTRRLKAVSEIHALKALLREAQTEIIRLKGIQGSKQPSKPMQSLEGEAAFASNAETQADASKTMASKTLDASNTDCCIQSGDNSRVSPAILLESESALKTSIETKADHTLVSVGVEAKQETIRLEAGKALLHVASQTKACSLSSIPESVCVKIDPSEPTAASKATQWPLPHPPHLTLVMDAQCFTENEEITEASSVAVYERHVEKKSDDVFIGMSHETNSQIQTSDIDVKQLIEPGEIRSMDMTPYSRYSRSYYEQCFSLQDRIDALQANHAMLLALMEQKDVTMNAMSSRISLQQTEIESSRFTLRSARESKEAVEKERDELQRTALHHASNEKELQRELYSSRRFSRLSIRIMLRRIVQLEAQLQHNLDASEDVKAAAERELESQAAKLQIAVDERSNEAIQHRQDIEVLHREVQNFKSILATADRNFQRVSEQKASAQASLQQLSQTNSRLLQRVESQREKHDEMASEHERYKRSVNLLFKERNRLQQARRESDQQISLLEKQVEVNAKEILRLRSRMQLKSFDRNAVLKDCAVVPTRWQTQTESLQRNELEDVADPRVEPDNPHALIKATKLEKKSIPCLAECIAALGMETQRRRKMEVRLHAAQENERRARGSLSKVLAEHRKMFMQYKRNEKLLKAQLNQAREEASVRNRT